MDCKTEGTGAVWHTDLGERSELRSFPHPFPEIEKRAALKYDLRLGDAAVPNDVQQLTIVVASVVVLASQY
eukprot:659937-Amphidinium_carterae.1